MGRKRSYTPLNVFLNSRLVGQLVREPSGGVSFSYVPAWLDWEHRMPVSLSLPLQETRYSGAPVMAVFDNLLPDSDLNVLFWLLGATDGHGKNFSVSLLPGGRFHMTPLYDVLTVQPTVDARQIERKYFKLAMNFGNSNHYKLANIVGRHIVETGVQSGLSRTVVQGLFEELQETSHAIVEATFNQLPEDFPEALLASIDGALKARLHLLN